MNISKNHQQNVNKFLLRKVIDVLGKNNVKKVVLNMKVGGLYTKNTQKHTKTNATNNWSYMLVQTH